MAYAELYKKVLFENVIPFWEKCSRNDIYGGYYSCLGREGNVYDSDKFQWLQLRQIWTFAMLYNSYEQRSEWLELAEHGAKFQMLHGRNSEGDWYFSLDQQGRPLLAAYNIFTDAFACMAFAQLYKSTGKEAYAELAVSSFKRILKRRANPKGRYNKNIDSYRKTENFTLPMILCNLTLELEELLDKELVQLTIDDCVESVISKFYDPSSGLTLENVNSDGSLSDTYEGRLINPGHTIEAMWFIMDIGNKRGDEALIKLAKDRMLAMLEYGWDRKYGGIYYFLDRKGKPPQQLEWDQKLWWVHLEALVALLKGYAYTSDKSCLSWFEKVHAYAFEHFPDGHNEWYGYLNRRGEVLLDLKGGKWKGCFHVPRGLFYSWKILDELDL